MSVLSTVTAGADVLKGLGISADSFTFGGLFGASCSDAEKKAKTKLANLIEESTTYSERQSFIDSVNMNNPVSPTGQDMAHFYYGQGDCKHKNVGTGDQRYLDQLESWISKKVSEAKAGPTAPEDKYSSNPGYTSEPTGESEQSPAPAMASIGGGMLNGMAVPILILVGILFAFNKYQNA